MAIVTISRGTMSGGRELARCLGARLGYRVIAREDLVAETARAYGIREENLVRGLGRGPRLLDRFRIDRRIYLAAAQAALCRLVEGDEVVYHGHAGHLLLEGVRPVVRVRIVAPLEYRLEAAMRDHGLSREGAERFVAEADAERRSWTRFLYGVEWGDPALYDLVINLEKVSCDAACELVAELAARPEFAVREEDRRRLHELFLRAHVRAKLYLNPRVAAAADRLDVEVEADRVTVRGLVPDGAVLAEVERTLRGLTEVRELDLTWLGVAVRL